MSDASILLQPPWKRVADENKNFKCIGCKGDNLYYVSHESSDGAYDDYNYKCQNCGKSWWTESSDY
jgi:DNA-directed RNA polymerase subunit M/transcription elongation factor TFIIS